MREALTRLASERLLQANPNQRFRVQPLALPDLLDLRRVRVEIEALTVRDSVATGDVAWESELLAAHHRLLGATNPDTSRPNYVWREAHSRFHAVLADACTSPLLKALRQQLFDSAELYRYWSAAAEPQKRRRPVPKEHKRSSMLHWNTTPITWSNSSPATSSGPPTIS